MIHPRAVRAVPNPTLDSMIRTFSATSTVVMIALLATAATPDHSLAQSPAPAVAARGESAALTPTARAVRTAEEIRLDGRDDDAVWATAPVTDDFFQFTPGEGRPARFRTTFRVAYDDRTVYVFVRAYDPRPDSLVALLSRRDARTQSDWIKVVIDGYHDRRTGMQFMVNPAGVKRDASIYSDVREDNAWDGVWDVVTQIERDGWTAEFAIPLSQLRYSPGDSQVFGFGVWRDIARFGERDAWPLYRPSGNSFASQLGDLVGIEGIGRNRRLEILPYIVTKNVSLPSVGGAGWDHPQQQSAGVDIKAGLTSNITIDATINPDFGQVEADPAVINLSAFEVRFDERRPFFQEGVSLFRCNGPCEGIFYTRRIGRTPQLRASARDARFSAIQGAAKVTGRFANGTQFGFVAVSSARETGQSGQTIEPQTTTVVARLVRDFREGRSQVGTMLSGLVRDLDDDTEPYLRKDSYTALFQGYHRFGRWEVSGYTGQTVTSGSAAAIARTQLTSVHYHQRPDHERDYDPTATSMAGSVNSLTLRRFAGRVRWETTTRYAMANTELNDLGFVTLVNDASVKNQLSYSTVLPRGIYRRANAVVSNEMHWTTGGLPANFFAQLHGSMEFANFWTSSFTFMASQLGPSHCVSCARGGPALRLSPRRSLSVTMDGDGRRAIRPELDFALARGDDGRSWSRRVSPGVIARIGQRTSLALDLDYEQRVDDAQWHRNYGEMFSDTVHYSFTRLAQNIMGVTMRANITVTPELSFELYAQPFIATGERSDWREMTDARAKEYADRYAAFAPSYATLTDYNGAQFNSNAVLRWEYRPGSVMFLVWQQGRANGTADGSFAFDRDMDNLFASRPDNTLLLKVSYWFNP